MTEAEDPLLRSLTHTAVGIAASVLSFLMAAGLDKKAEAVVTITI